MTIKLTKLFEAGNFPGETSYSDKHAKYAKEDTVTVKGISQLLKQFGFEAASKDVNTSNYKTYAQWILKALKGKIWMTDPITRKKTKWKQAEDAYNAFVKAFKKLGITEIMTPKDNMEVHTDKTYLLQRKTTGEYYAGGNIHAPTTTMDKEKAAIISGIKIKDMKYNWPMSWDLIDLSKEPDEENLGGERVNELHFTGAELNVIRQDILNFLKSEYKKLKHTNPLDTYNLILQVLDTGRIMDKVKKIR
jgi:hypothetical protein